MEIKNLKFEHREGEKNGRKWTGVGVQFELNGVEYSSIIFPPRNKFGSGTAIKVAT